MKSLAAAGETGGGAIVLDGQGKRGTGSQLRGLLAIKPTPAPAPPFVWLLALNTMFAFLGWKVGDIPLWSVWSGIVIPVVLLDLFLSPRPASISVTREVPALLSLGEPHRVTITVENRSSRAVSMVVKDEPPVAFTRSSHLLRTQVGAMTNVVLTYTVTPFERGAYAFGGCTVRYATRWRLWSWQLRRSMPASVRVYPNIRALQRHHLLVQHHRQHEVGIRRMASYGRGTDFDRLRDYVPDDEPRQINWLATARRGRLTVNHYQDPRNQTVMILLDAGRLGAARMDEQGTRLDHALNAGLLLAQTALVHDDHVGALVFADDVLAYLPPGRGNRQMRLLLHMLYDVKPLHVESDFGAAMTFLRTRVRKRSLVCLFTDLAESETARQLTEHMTRLQPQHLPLCLAIADPALLEIAGQAPSVSAAVYEKAVAREIMVSRERAVTTLRRRGVGVVDAPPTHIHVETLNMFFDIKARSRI